jgi:ATPase subunit of ABC transporter with duplicated ATPase domains
MAENSAQTTVRPRVWVSQLTFSDGTSVSLVKDDVVVLVGPNNGGKSATLRSILEKSQASQTFSPVVHSMQLSKDGSAEQLLEWLTPLSRVNLKDPANPHFDAPGLSLSQGGREEILGSCV